DRWAEQVRLHRELSGELAEKKARAEAVQSAHRLAFIQCVGSRDMRFNRHCSGFCCMHSIKEAIIAREHDQEAEVSVFGMDIRAVGKGFEEYRNRSAREAGVRYVRTRVAEITEQADHTPLVWYEDTKSREVRGLPFDLVILATACEPGASSARLAQILGVSLDESGFFRTDPSQPLDTDRPGVFVCGCAQGPMDIPESVAQASSAAARAAQVLSGPLAS
ncbi:MAG: CoB--CoM heterodisulfide reductase iron-sulfur subunit A family (seleno)protein, partial [Acidobacteriota bacterium]